MPISTIKYKLSHGFIHNWLVAGPMPVTIPDLSIFPPEDLKSSILRQFSQPELEVTIPPVDLGSLGPVSENNPSIHWRYYKCLDDHLVNFSSTYPTCQFLRSWAYAGINLSEPRQVSLFFASYSPAEIWLNGQLLHKQVDFQEQLTGRIPVQASFQAGHNDLLVRLSTVALRETAYAFALQLQGTPADEIDIVLPTEIEENLVKIRMALENLVEKAYLDRYVFGYLSGDLYDKNELIKLRFSSDLDWAGEITHRLQSLQGDIFQSGIKTCEAGSEFELARMFPLRNGPHHLALLPVESDYYQKKIQFERKDPFWIVRTPFATTPKSTIHERAQSALGDASKRRNDHIFVEIAKIALGKWENLNHKVLTAAINRIQQRQEGSIQDLLGILSIRLRFWERRHFQDDLRSAIKSTIKGYRYWTEEPRTESMDYVSENRQILFHTCEYLAGQLLPEDEFVDSRKSGRWHRDRAEERLVAWMQQRGQYGFQQWDLPAPVEATLSALSHLVDLAKSDTVRELASILMDKIFFSLAINSYKGMLGSSQGQSDIGSVLSHRLEATSGISRLMWGLGNFNESVMGTVSLACCRKYELPETIQQIALDVPTALWGRERCGLPKTSETASDSKLWEVNKVIYKTDDYILTSAQDYYPGEPGGQEHIWQATLGPDAVVFVNHPGSMSENDTHTPNLWVGNRILPCVAQWGDVLIALYHLPQDDWLGFTHAYFPASTFDEYYLAGNWAFARKGNGYLALYAANGLEWITGGKTALRELRSRGLENCWICHMGQALLDGSFTEFQEKILAMNLKVDGLSVRLESLRGEALSFGWEETLLVNGQEQALSGFNHFENPYCVSEIPAQQMEIFLGEEGIRLKF